MLLYASVKNTESEVSEVGLSANVLGPLGVGRARAGFCRTPGACGAPFARLKKPQAKSSACRDPLRNLNNKQDFGVFAVATLFIKGSWEAILELRMTFT
jgi:hypothetical protein